MQKAFSCRGIIMVAHYLDLAVGGCRSPLVVTFCVFSLAKNFHNDRRCLSSNIVLNMLRLVTSNNHYHYLRYPFTWMPNNGHAIHSYNALFACSPPLFLFDITSIQMQTDIFLFTSNNLQESCAVFYIQSRDQWFNSLWPIVAIWQHTSGSILVQVMACDWWCQGMTLTNVCELLVRTCGI